MKRLKAKAMSKKGETLAEILIAILIIALAAGLFATMYAASMSINTAARQEDEKFYQAAKELEEKIDSSDASENKGQITYTPAGANSGEAGTVPPANVEMFEEDGMTVYKYAGGKSS